jgi:hypothetical protein
MKNKPRSDWIAYLLFILGWLPPFGFLFGTQWLFLAIGASLGCVSTQPQDRGKTERKGALFCMSTKERWIEFLLYLFCTLLLAGGGTYVKSGTFVTCHSGRARSTCAGGQVWTDCGSPCIKTCTAPSPMCITVCEAKCQCPDHQPIWHSVAFGDGIAEHRCISSGECDITTYPRNISDPEKLSFDDDDGIGIDCLYNLQTPMYIFMYLGHYLALSVNYWRWVLDLPLVIFSAAYPQMPRLRLSLYTSVAPLCLKLVSAAVEPKDQTCEEVWGKQSSDEQSSGKQRSGKRYTRCRAKCENVIVVCWVLHTAFWCGIYQWELGSSNWAPFVVITLLWPIAVVASAYIFFFASCSWEGRPKLAPAPGGLHGVSGAPLGLAAPVVAATPPNLAV